MSKEGKGYRQGERAHEAVLIFIAAMGMGIYRSITSAAKGYNIHAHDFERHESDKRYDTVVMNPPFSDRKDAAHIIRAYEMLNPGGKCIFA